MIVVPTPVPYNKMTNSQPITLMNVKDPLATPSF